MLTWFWFILFLKPWTRSPETICSHNPGRGRPNTAAGMYRGLWYVSCDCSEETRHGVGWSLGFDAVICFWGPKLYGNCKKFSLRTLTHARKSFWLTYTVVGAFRARRLNFKTVPAHGAGIWAACIKGRCWKCGPSLPREVQNRQTSNVSFWRD